MFIEDVILENDKRGIADLRRLIPNDFCSDAADRVLKETGTVLITTGFYILNARAPETDGPPGALAIGDALEKLGYDVHYVADRQTVILLRNICSTGANVIEFPITSYEESVSFCQNLISDLSPSLLISIERCAAASDGLYRNMRDLDISEHTAKIDLLFGMHKQTIGIGDGGNEIGMGNLQTAIKDSNTLVNYPVTSQTSNLIISSVSNWGGLGLVAALSLKTGLNLLPSESEHSRSITSIVDMGAVDGVSGANDYMVDGFSIPDNLTVLNKLNDFVNSSI
jgi:hypothetical protein